MYFRVPQCLVSLPTEVGSSDSESPRASASKDAPAPIDALIADIRVSKDCTQDGVAPADVVPLIQSLPAAPFTLQRLCEVVVAEGGGGYKSRPKLAYALHRLASVSSTLQPVAVEDRWAGGSSGAGDDQEEDEGEKERGGGADSPTQQQSATQGASRDDVGVGAELSGGAARVGTDDASPASAGGVQRPFSAKRPREETGAEDAEGGQEGAAGGEGAGTAAAAMAGGDAVLVPLTAEAADAEQSPAKRPRPAQ